MISPRSHGSTLVRGTILAVSTLGAAVLTGSTPAPDWTASGDQNYSGFSNSVARAGDTNGDGFDDVLVGDYGHSGAITHEGRAYVYLGSPEGTETEPAWSRDGGAFDALFGITVGGAGDVNDDGYADILVSGIANQNYGRVDLFLGSADGPSPEPDWTTQGTSYAQNIGYSLAGGGDVNGDGIDDFLVGSDGPARTASLFLGSSSGPSLQPSWVLDAIDYYGTRTAVSFAGDVNRDGYDDAIVGWPYYSADIYQAGRVFLYLGSPSGLAPTPAWSVDGNRQFLHLGYSVSAGDVNGDGYSDLIIGSNPSYYAPLSDTGEVRVYLGSAAGLPAEPAWRAALGQGIDFGISVDSPGDFDGDGFDDLIVGSKTYHQWLGGVFLYHGSASGPMERPFWVATSDIAYSYFGERARGAGDVNGDGSPDLIVSAPQYGPSNAFFGRAFGYLLYPDSQTDTDQDGITDERDNCLSVRNHRQANADGDRAGDACDNCPTTPSSDQFDTDQDGIGDACDPCINGCDVEGILVEFSGAHGMGAGTIRWYTTRESNMQGFNVVEIDERGEPIQVNPQLIACNFCTTGVGSGYSAELERHRSGRNLFVEVLRTDGTSELFGPAERVPQRETRFSGSRSRRSGRSAPPVQANPAAPRQKGETGSGRK